MKLQILSLVLAAISSASAAAGGGAGFTFRYNLVFGSRSATEPDARQFCIQRGGALAIYELSAKDDLMKVLGTRKGQVSFAFVDDPSLSACTALFQDGSLQVVACDQPAPFICQFLSPPNQA